MASDDTEALLRRLGVTDEEDWEPVRDAPRVWGGCTHHIAAYPPRDYPLDTEEIECPTCGAPLTAPRGSRIIGYGEHD